MSKEECYIQLVVTYAQGNRNNNNPDKIEIKVNQGNIILISKSSEELYLRIGDEGDPTHVENIMEEFRGRIEYYLRQIEKQLTSYERQNETPNLPKNSNYNPLRHW